MQQRVRTLTLPGLKECNKVVEFAKANPDQGLTFRSGVLDWRSVCVGTITDASHAEEEEWVEATQTLEPYRSQG